MTQSGETDRSARDRGREVRQKGQEVAGTVQDKGRDVADTARENAGEVIQEATARSRDLYEQMKDQVSGEAEGQVRRFAANIRHLADDLRHMSESAKPDSPAVSVVHELADRGHLLADRLDRQGPGELLDDVREFARRKPGVFLAGAALAGFAVARLGRGVGAAGSGGPVGGDEGREREQPPSLPPAEAGYAPDTAPPLGREVPSGAGVPPVAGLPPEPGVPPRTPPAPGTAPGWQP
ncbi:hypothetical protein [Streptomyces sp. SYP-A7185]|uniref:hypothetical protein n=1 Tax=Streptomyces sp. SYP-A7185 TaxID=3040076 RepID=UPI0038F65F75